MNFRCPWTTLRAAETAAAKAEAHGYSRAAKMGRDELEREQAAWREQWKPLLAKAMSLGATRRDHSGDFMLHVGVARDMLEMAAMHNDPKVWEYISDQLAYEFKRQISTLNFAGLHRMAAEAEYRNPPRAPARASDPVRWSFEG